MDAAGAMCVTVIAAAAGCVIISALKYVMYHNIYLKMLHLILVVYKLLISHLVLT